MARSSKEPKPKYAPIQSEIRRAQDSWWIRCPKDDWIKAEACHKSFMDVNALKNKDHHCFNCQNGKEYRIKLAHGQMDRSYYDMLYKIKK